MSKEVIRMLKSRVKQFTFRTLSEYSSIFRRAKPTPTGGVSSVKYRAVVRARALQVVSGLWASHPGTGIIFLVRIFSGRSFRASSRSAAGSFTSYCIVCG